MSGGGVALGPKPRSYAQRTPKKMVRLALLSALSDRAEIGRIALIDDWQIEAPKTKDAATILRKLKLAGTVLVVLAQDELDVERSFANLPQVQTTTFGELSAHDVLRADWLLFSDRTLPTAVSDFSGTHVAADAEPEAEESAEGAESAEVSVKAEKAAAVVADAEEIDDTAPKAEAVEEAPAKPRARTDKRTKAVPEPEAATPMESGTEEADADA